MAPFERIIWIVLDSVGIGALPDAADYDDVGRDTLGHIAKSRPLALPNLVRLGLANIAPLDHLTPSARPEGCYGKGATHSPGKDTTTGHWEMAGIWLPQAFPVYKHGFPRELIEQFERAIGRKTIGNKPASGTEIIKELGEEHVRTGFPIVYTSGDSVFQIAAHEDVIPIAELYRMCEIARKMLDGPNKVGRVIARPFTGAPGNFRRTERRHDYAVEPPQPDADGRARRTKNSDLRHRQNSRYLQRPRRRSLRHDEKQRGRHAETPRHACRAEERPHLRQSCGFRHALRTPQRRGGVCKIARGIRRASCAAAEGARRRETC